MAIQIGEDSPDDKLSLHKRLADLYAEMERLDEAVEIYALMLNEEKIGELQGLKADVFESRARIYATQARYTDAFNDLDEVITIRAKQQSSVDLIRAQAEKGWVHYLAGNVEQGYQMLKKSRSETAEHDQTNRALLDSQIAEILGNPTTHLYNPQQATAYATTALQGLEKVQFKKGTIDIHKRLASLTKQEGQWTAYAEHIEKAHALELELLSEQAQKKALITEASRKLAIVEKEQEITHKKNAELEERNDIIRAKNTELESLNQRLTRLNQEKNEFLGIAAHDLKNPLASITLQTTLLERELTDKSVNDITKTLNGIRSRAQDMLNLITRILDINAIESDAEELEFYEFNLSDAVKRVVEDTQAQALTKKIALNYSGEDVTVLADRPSMMQVAENLISNGLKYTPPGGTVDVQVTQNGERCRLVVNDTGPGISAEEIGKLFERYRRLSPQPTGGESSTGLGLSIVKRLVEAMNGRVWCESTVNSGSQFIVELPSPTKQ